MTTPEDIITAFGKDGALEAIKSARDEGLVRYIGFSAHSVEAAMQALKLFEFDTMLVPINFVVWYNGNFESQLVEYTQSRGTTILAIKSLAPSTMPEGTLSTEEKASLMLSSLFHCPFLLGKRDPTVWRLNWLPRLFPFRRRRRMY